MGLHYVHCDSAYKKDHHTKSDYEVFMTPPIQNVKRVALTRLSVPNTFYNVNEWNNTIRWYEIKTTSVGQTDGTVDKYLQADIPIGFYSAAQLSSLVQTAMNNTPNRTFPGESVNMSYFISVLPLTTGFHTTIRGDHTSNYNKEWAIAIDTKAEFHGSIWDLLGFSIAQCVVGDYYDREIDMHISYSGNTVSTIDVNTRTLTSTKSARETYPFLQLVSDTLASNSRELQHDNGSGVHTKPSKRLSIIPVSVNRYSWVHFEVQHQYEWHDLSGTISKFDLKFTDDKGNAFSDDAMGEYQCTLIFETEDHNERNDERELLGKLGYIKAHCR
jgi:hypothetical protein